MVAQYKLKRLTGYQSKDESRPVDYERSERMRSKKEVRQGMKDNLDYNDRLLRDEIQWEDEMRMASECWEREKLDPENYRCTCRFVNEEE